MEISGKDGIIGQNTENGILRRQRWLHGAWWAKKRMGWRSWVWVNYHDLGFSSNIRTRVGSRGSGGGNV